MPLWPKVREQNSLLRHCLTQRAQTGKYLLYATQRWGCRQNLGRLETFPDGQPGSRYLLAVSLQISIKQLLKLLSLPKCVISIEK